MLSKVIFKHQRYGLHNLIVSILKKIFIWRKTLINSGKNSLKEDCYINSGHVFPQIKEDNTFYKYSILLLLFSILFYIEKNKFNKLLNKVIFKHQSMVYFI